MDKNNLVPYRIKRITYIKIVNRLSHKHEASIVEGAKITEIKLKDSTNLDDIGELMVDGRVYNVHEIPTIKNVSLLFGNTLGIFVDMSKKFCVKIYEIVSKDIEYIEYKEKIYSCDVYRFIIDHTYLLKDERGVIVCNLDTSMILKFISQNANTDSYEELMGKLCMKNLHDNEDIYIDVSNDRHGHGIIIGNNSIVYNVKIILNSLL